MIGVILQIIARPVSNFRCSISTLKMLSITLKHSLTFTQPFDPCHEKTYLGRKLRTGLLMTRLISTFQVATSEDFVEIFFYLCPFDAPFAAVKQFRSSITVTDGVLTRVTNFRYIITKTRPCNIQRYFTAVKMFVFRLNFLIFFLFLLKTLIVGTR